eukprot:4107913-Amphidinium_carterae.1
MRFHHGGLQVQGVLCDSTSESMLLMQHSTGCPATTTTTTTPPPPAGFVGQVANETVKSDKTHLTCQMSIFKSFS